jgi:aldehyde:ferredoxin oxidoreductase
MNKQKFYGYNGYILRVDLTNHKIKIEPIEEDWCKRWIGGTGFGANILWNEVPKGVTWNSPENRLIFGIGPLTGTGLNGAGGFSVVGKGPMTNMAGCSQANGYMGAFLKFCGFDAIIIEGVSSEWVYLFVDKGYAELKRATDIIGCDTFECERIIKKGLGVSGKGASVFSIGPAGENQVRFACIVGDNGHVASKGGLGAVMGSKRLKAIVVLRNKNKIPIYNLENFKKINEAIIEESKRDYEGIFYKWGTGGIVERAHAIGILPVKNYTTSIFPGHEKLDAKYTRKRFQIEPDFSCFACRVRHCKIVNITEGQYNGLRAPEPEYEMIAAFGPMIGQNDYGAVTYLTDITDRLGLDGNETGWIMGFIMEAYEKGILRKEDLDGLEMKWGNVESVAELIRKISLREGIGNLFAEGVKRAVETIGGSAPDMAIYTMKGSTPRGHDHRGRWSELFDTCLSNTSTIEATFGGPTSERYGLPPLTDPISPEQVSMLNAKVNGMRQLDDSFVICRFAATNPKLLIEALNTVTNWDWTLKDAMTTGKRIVNMLRLFNLRHGYNVALETPSPRYGSAPIDGPWKGISIMPFWEQMRKNYYKHMGWDYNNGKPFPETLRDLGMEEFIQTLSSL